jgi:hypothetical protein
MKKSTRYIPWNAEADKEAEEYINTKEETISAIEQFKPGQELFNRQMRILELEEQIVTYCKENPAAEEWFQITVNRDNNENS